jgi:hypothetical protein
MQTITTIGLDIAKSINVAGLAGLRNLKSPGAGSKLTARQRAELAELVEGHPDPAVYGVRRWRPGRSARSPPRSTTNATPFSLRSCSRSISANATAKCPTGPPRGLIRASAAPAARISCSAC